MGNYGKWMFPLGILMTGGGIGVAVNSGNNDATSSISIALLGVMFLFFGLARIVQGKDRKIFGKIIRPKAAARGAAIYSFLIFNISPFFIPGGEMLTDLKLALGGGSSVPPFPLAILAMFFSGNEYSQYGWIIPLYIFYLLTFFLGLILSGKFPKTFHVVFNVVMLFGFYLLLNLGQSFFLWGCLSDSTLPEIQLSSTIHLGVGLWIMLISLYFIMRLIKKTGSAFQAFYVRGGKKTLVFIFIIICYLGTAVPIYYGVQYALDNTAAYKWSYVNYVGILFFLTIGLKLITQLLATLKEFTRQRKGSSDEIEGMNTGFKAAFFLMIFFFAWAPLLLPIIDQGMNSKHNSIYNENWNGWSNFKDELEDQGYNISNIQSSLSTIVSLNQPNKQIVLVCAGPNKFYNPAAEIPFLLSAFKENSNFSMFIAEDHGTGEDLLFQTFVASKAQSPLTFIPDGVLLDNESYWKQPEFPIIRNFDSVSPITAGISDVVLSYASGFLGGDILDELGWNMLGRTSDSYSFIDVADNVTKERNGAYDPKTDRYYLESTMGSLLNSTASSADLGPEVELIAELLAEGVPLGGYAQTVFASKEISSTSRIICTTDASFLNNELTSIDQFDNMQLGLNMMEWLLCGIDPEDALIIFDEAHIRAESGATDVSSTGSFGIIQRYVNWLSTNPILGLIYPLFALRSVKKWIPKEDEKKELQLQDLEEAERRQAILTFRTSSFFAKKINWYKNKKKYRLALIQLFRRLERKINMLLGARAKRDVDEIMIVIKQEQGNIPKETLKRMETFFKKMHALKENKDDVQEVEEFEKLFMEMRWINDKI